MFLTGNHGARVGEAIGLAAVALLFVVERLVPGGANGAIHFMRIPYYGDVRVGVVIDSEREGWFCRNMIFDEVPTACMKPSITENHEEEASRNSRS